MDIFRLKNKQPAKFWMLAGLTVLLLIIAITAITRSWYNHNLGPVSSSDATKYFTVVSGENPAEIGENLERAELIRSGRAFVTYVRGSGHYNALQAGTYSLSPSMGTVRIVSMMVKGEVTKNLLTILPGKNLEELKSAFRKEGYGPGEINRAFRAASYRGHPALDSLPPGASLEGYLYPDSFQKEADTPAETIIRQSLDEMQKHLKQDIIDGFRKQGLSVHEGIILGSIILKESGDPDVQPVISQVFLTRLDRGIPLQADPTAFYAADITGQRRSLSINSPYNTYLNNGLPPGPIANVTEDAMRAAAAPAKTDYLYFVAGDDGKVHFSHTKEQHEEATRKYCTEACGN